MTEDILPSFVLAFKAASEAGKRQGYRRHASLLGKVVAALEHRGVVHRRFEPRIDELLCLKQLWDMLVQLERTTGTVGHHDKGYSGGQEIWNFVQNAPLKAQPAMLFLIIKYVEWMLSVEITLSISPMSPNIMACLRTSASSQFGVWNYITMRATVNLAVCYRLSDKIVSALGIEDELVEEYIKEVKHVSGQKWLPGYHGIERLLAEYKLREWYFEAIRVVKAINGPVVQQYGNNDGLAMNHYCLLCDFYKGAGVQIDATEGAVMLLASARHGKEVLVRVLLNSGVDIEAKDSSGWTALHHAALLGREPVVRLLFERGANKKERTDTGDTGCTALHLAALTRGNEGMLKLLLENGIDIDTRTNDENTALHKAAWCGDESLVQLLLERGTNINAKTSDGTTALHIAAASTEENKATLLLLLGRNIEIEAKRSRNRTALHEAAAQGNTVLMQVLLERGANIWAKTADGSTALHLATLSENVAKVRLLLEKGLDVDAETDGGVSALQAGAATGTKAVVQLLLDWKSSDGLRIGEMWIAMLIAVCEGHHGVMMLILKNSGYRTFKRVGVYLCAHAVYIFVPLLLVLSVLLLKAFPGLGVVPTLFLRRG